MTSEERAVLLRERFRALFPAAQYPHVVLKKRKIVTRGNRVRPTYPYGAALADHVVTWIEKSDAREVAMVAPKRRRRGNAALNVISEKLKPGANVWPRRGRSFSGVV